MKKIIIILILMPILAVQVFSQGLSDCIFNPNYPPIYNNGFEYQVFSREDLCDGTYRYTVSIVNYNKYGLSNAAIGLPLNYTSLWPENGSIYLRFRNYTVLNPTDNPFYSIKYETIGEGIAEGEEDLFIFILPYEVGDFYIQIQAKGGTIVVYDEGLYPAYDCPCFPAASHTIPEFSTIGLLIGVLIIAGESYALLKKK